MDGGSPKVLENAGHRATPSVVTFGSRSEQFIGVTAKRMSILRAGNTVSAAKRLIGRQFADVQEEAKYLPCEIVEASSGGVWIKAGGEVHHPSEICASVLEHLLVTAGGEVCHPAEHRDVSAVIAVPAAFTMRHRQAIIDAARIAGINPLLLVDSPTLAAMAYGSGRGRHHQEVVAVYDLGAGSFSVGIIEVYGGVFETIAINGDLSLGGEDFDTAIVKHLLSEFEHSHGIDLSQDQLAVSRLREAAESAKLELSSQIQTDIQVLHITRDHEGPKHLKTQLTRARLEQLVHELVQRTRHACEACLKDARLKLDEIDKVLLVGGSTRMPCVQDAVRKIFNRTPSKAVNPDEAVALGAAIQAGIFCGNVKDKHLLRVLPFSLGIESCGGMFTRVVPRNTTLPTKKSIVISTSNQTQFKVKVFEGEREMAADNTLLGQLDLKDSLLDKQDVEVTCDIDPMYRIDVSAYCRQSGSRQNLTIRPNAGSSDAELVKLVQEIAVASAKREAAWCEWRRFKEVGQWRRFKVRQTLHQGQMPEKEVVPEESDDCSFTKQFKFMWIAIACSGIGLFSLMLAPSSAANSAGDDLIMPKHAFEEVPEAVDDPTMPKHTFEQAPEAADDPIMPKSDVEQVPEAADDPTLPEHSFEEAAEAADDPTMPKHTLEQVAEAADDPIIPKRDVEQVPEAADDPTLPEHSFEEAAEAADDPTMPKHTLEQVHCLSTLSKRQQKLQMIPQCPNTLSNRCQKLLIIPKYRSVMSNKCQKLRMMPHCLSTLSNRPRQKLQMIP
eukprot:TRINITY_DN8740_c0_g1_i1.p1 TRINITY_DN8740_c0_g1~~TRINITY_DN8740_c0_g1_i1.p1  ORF type:complete len:848 (+),score=155.09 TRINITY_DN8740_c0_g1_i1:204-2546(+)